MYDENMYDVNMYDVNMYDENTSILNYKNYKSENQRTLFSSKIRNAGIDHIPIVVDSPNKNLASAISTKTANYTFEKYGLEISLHSESNIRHLINIIKQKMIDNDNIIPFDLYLENDVYPINENINIDFCFLYKKYRNVSDNILYFIIQPKITMSERILLYVKSKFFNN